MKTQAQQVGPLTCRAYGAETPELAVVLCHGYGAPGTDLVPLGAEVEARRPALAGRVRWVFPEAPHPLPPPQGWLGGRQWWEIDLAAFEHAMATGTVRDLRGQVPEGLAEARRALVGTLDALTRHLRLPMGRVVLGGFSQGAMLATDVTLRLEEAPAALVALSGTLLDEATWRRLAPTRRGLPVLQSHGRFDPLLPYQGAEWLRDLLREAGLDVRFVPFDGPHTIAAEVLDAFGDLLAARLPAT